MRFNFFRLLALGRRRPAANRVGVTGPFFAWSDTWQLVINTGTTIVTFLMVFVIQNTQNLDTQALQLKLDELIRVNTAARNSLMGLEEKSEAEVENIKSAFVELASTGDASLEIKKRQAARIRCFRAAKTPYLTTP